MDDTRSALIIASDSYTDPGLRRLHSPASDAHALAAVLRDPKIGDFEVCTLLNRPAHEVNLAVEDFFADRKPGDLLLVHFSCHGVKDADGELYFAASNTMLGRLGATAVAAEFVNRQMSRSRSRRVVLLLDCCYAGAFQRGLVARAGTDIGIEQQFGGRGRAVITASSAMEYAFEGDELTDTREMAPSVFTRALVEGLETGDADRDQDGLVSLDELYDYVYEKVRVATPHQTPGKWTFAMEGDLYIARRSRPVTTPAVLPPELQHAIESPLAGIRAGAVQELAHLLRAKHAGMALAARLALERLTDDDSRAVAAAAAAALVAHAPAVPPASPPPRLALSATVIDLGRLRQHGQSPESRVRISNTGGGSLNARAAPTVNWIKLRQTGDELVIAVDTSAVGVYEGAVAIDSDGGSAIIAVRARVDPTSLPAQETAAAARLRPSPDVPLDSRPTPASGPPLSTAFPAPLDAAAAKAALPVAAASAPAPAAPAGQAAREPADDRTQASGADGHLAPSQARDDRHARTGVDSESGAGEKASRAPRPHRAGSAIRRRPVVIVASAVIAVIGLLTAIIIPSVSRSAPPVRPAHSAGSTRPAPPAALTPRLRWVTRTGDTVESRPTVVSGTVYFGSWDHKVYALDAATGRPRWTYTTKDGVRSSPAVVGGTVYIGSWDHKVYALDAATGRPRWSYATGGPVSSTPTVADGTVYIGSWDHKVYALDAATGRLRWTYTTGSFIYSSPAVTDGTVYIGSWDHRVYALDAATGRLRWTYTTGGPVYSSPVVVHGTVYIGSRDFKVYALDAATGRLRWSYTTGGPVPSSPAVADGTVYADSRDDMVYALNAATGGLRWSYTTVSYGISSPAVAGGTVYIGSTDHKVYALNAATGRLLWSYTVGDGTLYSPRVAGGTVYIGSTDHNLYALSAEP